MRFMVKQNLLQVFLVTLISLLAFTCQALADTIIAPVETGNKWGYIDQKGQFVIPAQFDLAYAFSDGLARVKIGGKFGFIDNSGQVVIPAQFNNAFDFKDGFAAINIGGKSGYVDKNGQITDHREFTVDNNELIPIQQAFPQNGMPFGYVKYGYMNHNGQIAIPLRFDSAGNFKEGLAKVGIKDQYGYIDASGQFAIPIQFDAADDFNDGVALVKKGGKLFYVDKSGQVIISSEITAQYYQVYDFCEGLARVFIKDVSDGTSLTGKYGFIDKHGQLAIPIQFEEASDFQEGLAAILISGKFGFIDKNGQLVIAAQFDRVGSWCKL